MLSIVFFIIEHVEKLKEKMRQGERERDLKYPPIGDLGKQIMVCLHNGKLLHDY